jgi:hypothetical protein
VLHRVTIDAYRYGPQEKCHGDPLQSAPSLPRRSGCIRCCNRDSVPAVASPDHSNGTTVDLRIGDTSSKRCMNCTET